MPSEADRPAQELLGQYTRAPDGEADRVLGRLIDCLRDCVRPFLIRKGVRGPDLDDLVGDVCLRLVVPLRRSRSGETPPIGDPGDYARRVAANLLTDAIRHGSPRYRVKLQILEVLDYGAPAGLFARWTVAADALGGFRKWSGLPFRPTRRYLLLCANSAGFRAKQLRHKEPGELDLPTLMAHLFHWVGTPLTVNDLARRVADLQGVSDPVPVSLDDAGTAAQADDDTNPFLKAAGGQILDMLYREVRELPRLQRLAFLLGLSRTELLLLAGSATAVAGALALSLNAFAPLWASLPLPDSRIAQELSATELQVSNLRKCARERLWRRKDSWEKGGTAR